MRLNKIKLSGFKSFVDPTTVTLPGGLTGIVGPNGCGKSNIIDAVRWVMGESSAKHLRGDSMADVIFNGSTSRKPVGQASIELLFDNSDGTLGGQYAAYSEISVRRQVNRDGQSAYYLNGTRCRKRDITDVFLGTGLGPRSYSIIEQGMISRVIEARPEELRGYLEEAAGISLYKERRRETERRIRDTTENLERLQDVRDEVGRQLDKLKRQAETAERYKALRAEERERRAELYLLRLRGLEAQRETLRRELAERETEQESLVARQRALERENETVRARHIEDSDHLNEIQGRFYSIGSDIARVEQRIAHRRELRESGERELTQSREALKELDQSLEEDHEKLTVLLERLETLEPEAEEAAEREEAAREAVDHAQAALESWRERWEQFSEAASEPVRTAQVERTRIEQMERRSEELKRRRERLAEESERLRVDDAEAALADLGETDQTLTEDLAEVRERLAERQQRLEALDEDIAALSDELTSLRDERQQLAARRTSLQTLQEAALGQDGALADWLAERNLADCRQIARVVDVEPGWEAAVEAVLGSELQGLLAEAPDDLRQAADQPPAQARVSLFTDSGPAPQVPADSLTARVQGPAALRRRLAGILTAPDMSAALERLAGLGDEASVVIPDGSWFGQGWVRLGTEGGEGAGAGVIARERELAGLAERETALERQLASLQERLDRLQTDRRNEDDRREQDADEVNELERELSRVHTRIEHQRERIESVRARIDSLSAEREELAAELEAADEDLREARRRLDAALDASERMDEERERLTREKLELQQRLDDTREQLHERQRQGQDIALKRESARSARSSLETSLERTRSQRQRVLSQAEELTRRLDDLAEPGEDLEAERETLLARRLEVEEKLTEARERLGEAETRLRELEAARAEIAAATTQLRESLEGVRFREYELKIRAQTQSEQLDELGVSVAEAAERLPESADERTWAGELERIEQRIQRLGPINLAAIDEYEQLRERSEYLQAQHEDLTEAMETLQTAIRRIDRETRQRFKDTFEKVNAGLQRLFPRLFGGGHAYLELTDDDLLETGVTIMARPPGKKISNIHLLSGGEKALTAVSLVFAIFELNPAPFCMLDEVDAPLDEANVGRFCEMLRDLCHQVQFIVITHNKTTMEAATHLAGVTMSEPGVSRLVAVDVDEAAELAGA
jgi:chromosome segregation protein